ncbi:MAG: VPLPA-CTERM sorting domain-containing protein [Phycisphaerae bacterium]|jgi:hypothetical protein|nr:VPLPA-CTERM sorting domain-containing protein [Phycisphaerae bacterium]
MRCTLALLTLALGAAATSANAGQWNLTYDGQGSNLLTNVHYDANASWNAGAASSFNAIHVGEHLFHIGGLNYSTFCVQLYEGLNVGSTVCFDEVDVASVPDAPPEPGPMGAIKATLIQDLYWRFHDFATDESVDSATANLRNAAFQLAIYELSHENFDAGSAGDALAQIDLDQGAFQAAGRSQTAGSAEAVQLAADMLAALGGDGFHFFGSGLKGLTNPDYQDQLIVVPLPAVAGMALAGLGIVGMARRRMKKA